ncbi:MAG: hypothetical protein QMD85_03625 [Candidatus Aenigmarchaeota archaeon]|nr:hypothetical protein [Candidatus Aenigmarchaeota archaeon]MDI6722642.1 hypothetical protein [Candidatus Aenigmarchaeota archaeon]
MGYVRYKVPDETHEILRGVCKNLGLKESEISRIALFEYLKSIKAIEHSVHGGITKKLRIRH